MASPSTTQSELLAEPISIPLEAYHHSHRDPANSGGGDRPSEHDERPLTRTHHQLAWDGPDDKANPQNWSFARKLLITWVWIHGNLVATMSSSLFSSGAEAISAEFGASTETITLGVSLFVAGYGVGPLVWSPLSEQSGRRIPMLASMSLFTVFCLPVALGTNLETVLVGRFLSGCCAVAPVALFGAGFVDIWSPDTRPIALSAAIGVVLGGPLLAPVIGSFITQSRLGWRWTAWLSCLMGGSCLAMVYFCLPETFAPVLLRRKDQPATPRARPSVTSILKTDWSAATRRFLFMYLVRPFQLLATEPILILVTLYHSFVYGMLYLVFASYPIIFRQERQWKLGLSSLPFLGLLTGVLLGAGFIALSSRRSSTLRARQAGGGGPYAPEQRLPLMMIGSVFLPIGLFVFGWTSAPSISWQASVVASVPVGIGLIMVFVQCVNYILDVYANVANSALGANTIVRSLFAAAFPMFAGYLYHADFGVAWGTSILGFVSLAMIPIPVLFYKFGPKIRSWSKNTVHTQ